MQKIFPFPPNHPQKHLIFLCIFQDTICKPLLGTMIPEFYIIEKDINSFKKYIICCFYFSVELSSSS